MQIPQILGPSGSSNGTMPEPQNHRTSFLRFKGSQNLKLTDALGPIGPTSQYVKANVPGIQTHWNSLKDRKLTTSLGLPPTRPEIAVNLSSASLLSSMKAELLSILPPAWGQALPLTNCNSPQAHM